VTGSWKWPLTCI